MSEVVLKPGFYTEIKNGETAPGLKLSKVVLDTLVKKGILSTVDCCTYTLIGGGGGGGGITAVTLNKGATGLYLDVDGTLGTPVALNEGDLKLASALVVGTTTYPVGTSLGTLLAEFQKEIQFKNEGVNVGAVGQVSTVDFVGAGVDAAYVSGVLTVTIPGGGGTGNTNLALGTVTGTTVQVTSDTGTDVVLPSATITDAGLLSAADKVVINGIRTVQEDTANAFKGANVDTSTTGLAKVGVDINGQAVVTGTVTNTDTLLLYDTSTSTNVKASVFSLATGIAPMGSATTTLAGTQGVVPAPGIDQQNKFLSGGGLFSSPIPAWDTSTWEVDDIVYNPADNKIYRVTTAHSTPTFVLGNFTELSPSGSGLVRYSTPMVGGASTSQAIVSATGTGVTVTKVSTTVWTVDIPAGVELISLDLSVAAADTPGASVIVNFNSTSTLYNQDEATLLIPDVRGVNRLSGIPGTYNQTTAANLFPTVNAVGGGDLQLNISGYSASLGAGKSTIKFIF